MKTLYVHIGMPKTGTTAIQNFCTENRNVLNQKGYDYPKFKHIYGNTVGRARNGHFIVPEEFTTNREVFRKNMEIVSETFKTYPNVILSDEAIWSPPSKFKNMWKAMKEESIKGGYQLKVVVYLRRQDLYLSSIWNQFVKGKNETQAWADYVKNPARAGKMNYGTNLRVLASILGKDALLVRRFEPKQFLGGSIYADFLHTIGLEMSDDYAVSKYIRNEKLAGNTHEIMRIINGLPGIEREENRFFCKVLLSFSDVSAAEYPSEMFAKEEAQTFMQKYRKENQQVSDDFFNGEELFSQEWKDLPKWDKDNPHMQDDMIRFMVVCCQHLLEKNKALNEKVNQMEQEMNKMKHPLRAIRKKAANKGKRRE